MASQKLSYKDLILLEHSELSKKDPNYFEKVNEIIADHDFHKDIVIKKGKTSEIRGFLGYLKKFAKEVDEA